MKNITKVATITSCSISIIIGIVLTDYHDQIRTSHAGLAIIGNAEDCQREPYYCPANVLTVGIGSTNNVEQRSYSDDEIAQKWLSDIREAEQCVNQYGNGEKLPQSVFEAVTSITFNVGCTKLRNSTLYYYLNSDDYHSACNELPRWNKAGGKVLNGLTIRRQQERALCLTDLN